LRRPLTRTSLAGALAAGITALALVAAAPASADAPEQTTFVNEGFTGASAGTGYTLPSSPNGVNVACLTARASGASADSTIPGCGGATDTAGSGALRLTSNELNQAGGVGATQSVPITKGIDAVFDSYQYNGQGDRDNVTADGIVFYLAATDPYNPAVPTQIGQLGGSLGYSATPTRSGLAHAYLGLGLDRYGNFVHPNFGGNGCSADAARVRYPNSVTVRGPGDGTNGYCVVSTTAGKALSGSLSKAGAASRDEARVPVEIVINPTSSALTAQRADTVTVPAGNFAVIFTPIGGSQQVLMGGLPTLSTSGNAANVPASWIDPSTGYPYKLTYGWVAGTGSASDIHEVNYLEAQTAAGPVPVLSATTGGDKTVSHAGAGTYTITPTVIANGGTESQLIRTTTTFPVGVTPKLADEPGAGWSCTIAGQIETCDYAVDESAPVQPDTTLPAVSLPYTVTGGSRTATIATIVASTDAEAVTASADVTVEPQTVTIAAADATAEHGASVTLSATVASTSDDPTPSLGSVTFTDADTAEVLCTAPLTAAGSGSCDITAGAVGDHSVLVSYSGDVDHSALSGKKLTLTVTKIGTSVSLTVAPAQTDYGTAATLTAGNLPADATGTVTFNAGSAQLCSAELPTVTCATANSLAAGTYSVTATYSGDATHKTSTSSASILTVNKASAVIGIPVGGPGGPGGGDPGTDTTVTVTHGKTTDLTADVPDDATGTISYTTDDGTVLCTATLPERSCTIPDDLPGGTYTVRAVYSGDPNYEPSEGDPFQLVIAPQDTTIEAPAEPAHGTVGKKIRLTVSGLADGATGTVTFTAADGTVLCTATLPDTFCETDALPQGANVVTASYSGDASFAASTTTIQVNVDPVPVVKVEPSPKKALASTGSTIDPWVAAAGLALLLAGLATLVIRRTRRV
jgi:LPXTG-motif cell wall-anchored protein